MEKSLFISGPLDDLRDVLKIAIVEGRKVLKAKNVKVKPIVYPYSNGYLVVIEKDGCDGASVVGSGKKRL